MIDENIEAIKMYEDLLNCQQSTVDPSSFFDLLFDPTDIIQIKERIDLHPADAIYVRTPDISAVLSPIAKAQSESGAQFCINAVPKTFLDKIKYIHECERVCKPQWEIAGEEVRNTLSLSCDLFEKGRTFFIEADKLPDGNEIKTVDDKVRATTEILSSDLPISYVLDTGGRGPHIGIVLDETLPLGQFNQTVEEVLQRLPSWLDSGVGRINQAERMPGATRLNKRNEVVTVRLAHVGKRVPPEALYNWINEKPIISPAINRNTWACHNHDYFNCADDCEEAALKFIEQNGLKSSRQVRNGKIQVSCPRAENHKQGRDRNMSAFISVESGHVWCSACQTTVGWTCSRPNNRGERMREDKRAAQLIPTVIDEVDLASIKPNKLF